MLDDFKKELSDDKIDYISNRILKNDRNLLSKAHPSDESKNEMPILFGQWISIFYGELQDIKCRL